MGINIFIAFIGIALIAAAIVVFLREENVKFTAIAAVVGILVIIFALSFKIVPTGYTGVKTTFGQISDTVVNEGFNGKIPLVDKIVLVNNKQQDTTVEQTIWGEASDKTPVYVSKATITYQIAADKSAWLYANVSNVDNIITPEILSSAIKSAMVKFDTTKVTNRSCIEPEATKQIQAAFNDKYGENTISIIKVTIDNMDFEDSYNQAISAKSIAQQTQERQKIENDTAIAKAEADKKVKITNAEAEAEAKLIAARSESEANDLLTESLTDEILKSKYYEKWNGVLPQVVSDGNMLYNLGQ